MKCPNCGETGRGKVKCWDSRLCTDKGDATTRRRYTCLACHYRFNTFEFYEGTRIPRPYLLEQERLIVQRVRESLDLLESFFRRGAPIR